jgi:hypothetical protein
MLDIMMGNTCVLIDRSPNAALRRRVYGQAGEYRLPKWGLEYRTLSNFWLHAYPLMSLVTGLCRMAVGVIQASKSDDEKSPEEILIKSLNMKKVIRAINKNDLGLAQENWEVVRKFINEHILGDAHFGSGLYPRNLEDFEWFAKKIQEGGLQYWWDHDPLEHWTTKPEGHNTGWEVYCATTVRRDRLKKFVLPEENANAKSDPNPAL